MWTFVRNRLSNAACWPFIWVAVLLFIQVTVAHDEQYHREMVHQINCAKTTWTASYNKFAADKPADLPQPVGQNEDQNRTNKKAETEMMMRDEHMRELLKTSPLVPSAFDARLHWPNCASLHHVPNQGGCGSCWAIAASAVISDRICIHSKGVHQPEISTEDIVSCAKPNTGCHGGWPLLAFWAWLERGFVTGGPYGSNEGCRPYTIKNDCGIPCDYLQDWALPDNTPECVHKCQPMYQKDYEQDKYYGSILYSLNVSPLSRRSNFENDHKKEFSSPSKAMKFFQHNRAHEAAWKINLIQREIRTYGPVEACFSVFEDFLHYHSGVYTNVTGEWLYFHCIRLLGWGETEDKVPYWIVVNSFGKNWGQNGIFWLHQNYPLFSVTAGLP